MAAAARDARRVHEVPAAPVAGAQADLEEVNAPLPVARLAASAGLDYDAQRTCVRASCRWSGPPTRPRAGCDSSIAGPVAPGRLVLEMGSSDDLRDRQENDPQQGASADAAESEKTEPVWKLPERSDQAPGEETVQVNDAYTGGEAPPAEEPHSDDEQHPTGG